MPHFKILPADLHEAAQILTEARTFKESDRVDLTCEQGEVTFRVLGREYISPAAIRTAGAARLPIAILRQMAKAADTFGKDELEISISKGMVQVKAHTIKSEQIKILKAATRHIDLPDDAPARDFLALEFIFNPGQLKDSDLQDRVAEARKELHTALDQSSGLEAFGITREQLKMLVEQNLAGTAKTLKKVLLPHA